VPACHNELVDLIEQLGREQTNVVFEALQAVQVFIKGAVAEHFTQGVVLVDEFEQTVVVAIEVQANDTANQDAPQGHAGAPGGFVDAGRYVFFQQGKDVVAQGLGGVDVLQATQNFGDVVTRFEVEADVGDIDFTDEHLLILEDAHGLNPGQI